MNGILFGVCGCCGSAGTDESQVVQAAAMWYGFSTDNPGLKYLVRKEVFTLVGAYTATRTTSIDPVTGLFTYQYDPPYNTWMPQISNPTLPQERIWSYPEPNLHDPHGPLSGDGGAGFSIWPIWRPNVDYSLVTTFTQENTFETCRQIAVGRLSQVDLLNPDRVYPLAEGSSNGNVTYEDVVFGYHSEPPPDGIKHRVSRIVIWPQTIGDGAWPNEVGSGTLGQVILISSDVVNWAAGGWFGWVPGGAFAGEVLGVYGQAANGVMGTATNGAIIAQKSAQRHVADWLSERVSLAATPGADLVDTVRPGMVQAGESLFDPTDVPGIGYIQWSTAPAPGLTPP